MEYISILKAKTKSIIKSDNFENNFLKFAETQIFYKKEINSPKHFYYMIIATSITITMTITITITITLTSTLTIYDY